MHLCLFEDAGVHHLEPLTLTRHAADLRVGMYTIAEMHREAFRPESIGFIGRNHVAPVTRQEHPRAAVNDQHGDRAVLLVNARFISEPGPLIDRLAVATAKGEPERVFTQGDDVVAVWLPEGATQIMEGGMLSRDRFSNVSEERIDGARMIGRLWDLVADIEDRLEADFAALNRRGNEGATIHDGARILGDEVLIEPGAVIFPGAIINSLDGPVRIGEGAVVEENVVLRGPAYIGPKAQVKAGARVDSSVIGYWSKVGGEVHGSVLHSLSAKPHDGYLGNSYLGRWCNLGADTNTSNLKNDYGEVTMFDPVEQDFLPTGRQFLGLVMGDHSKSSINSMFNTGTVVGVSCNLFGSGFPPRHIPSFTWGGAESLVEYRLDKALRVAEAVMARRDTQLTETDKKMLAEVFEATAAARAALADS